MVRLSYAQANFLVEVLGDGSKWEKEEAGGINGILKQISAQLASPGYAEELIDIVANMVSNNRSKVVVGGPFLTALREAILSPRELATVKALSTTWQCCSRCGKNLVDGEVTTIIAQQLFCANCIAPSYHSCKGCGAKIAMTGVSRIITKGTKDCEVCARGGDAAKVGYTIQIDDRVYHQRVAIAREPTWRDLELAIRPPHAATPPPDAPLHPDDLWANTRIITTGTGVQGRWLDENAPPPTAPLVNGRRMDEPDEIIADEEGDVDEAL